MDIQLIMEDNPIYGNVQRLDDYDNYSEILITDEELDRELKAVDEAYRIFEENEAYRTFEENEAYRIFEENEAYRIFEENEAYRTFEENEDNNLRNRHKNLKDTSRNLSNTSNIIKIHKNTKTIYLTRFAFISLLFAVNMFAYYFTLNQHKFIKLIKN